MYCKIGWKCCEAYDPEKNTKLVIQPPGGKRYAKFVCASCNHFLKWSPSPATLKCMEDRKVVVEKMLLFEGLNEKQKAFLLNIKDNRYITPHQLGYIRNINVLYRMGYDI